MNTAPGAVRARIKDEARTILNGWTPSTPRTAVLWSTCATLLNRADRFTTWPPTVAQLTPRRYGHSRAVTGGDYWISVDGQGWHLTDLIPDTAETAKRRALVTGGWPEVLEVLTGGDVSPHLIAEARAVTAADAEVRAYFNWERNAGMTRAGWTGDMLAELERMHDQQVLVSRWSSDVAASIWDHCRPGPGTPRADSSQRQGRRQPCRA